MAHDWEVQAGRGHKQEMKTDELAQKLDEKAQKPEEQARHLVEVLEENLLSLRAEAQQYTGRAYSSVKSKLLEDSIKGEVLGPAEASSVWCHILIAHAQGLFTEWISFVIGVYC